MWRLLRGQQQLGFPTTIADRMNLPFAYIRSKPKDHGAGNQVEGRIFKGQKMVVIEDLISTGGSVLARWQLLKEKVPMFWAWWLFSPMNCQKRLRTLPMRTSNW